MRKYITIILLVAWAINILSFAVVRLFSHTTEAQLIYRKPAGADQRMNYLLAGTFNQPEPAFRFLVSELEGGVTYVNFKPTGWSALNVARQIINNIRRHNYDATLYVISVSDYVARYVEATIGPQVKVVAINPCPSSATVKWYWRIVAGIAGAGLTLATCLLGWISTIGFVKVEGGNYSLALMADQAAALAAGHPPYSFWNTIGAICSTHDQFLDNRKVAECYGAPIIEVEARHGETMNHPDLYLEAVRQIWDRQ